MDVFVPGAGAVGEVEGGTVWGVRVRPMALGNTSMGIVDARTYGSIVGCEVEDEAWETRSVGKGYGMEAIRMLCAPLSMTMM